MMNISFSTTQKNYVEKYLNHEKFNYLSDAQKHYIKDNIGDIRIQDPMMYAKPSIEIHHKQDEHYKNIMAL